MLITPRPGEELDPQKLAAYLGDKLDGAKGVPTVRQFGGGAANLTYLLQYPEAEYVLRRPPHGTLPKGAHDMEREAKVLARLPDAFPPAPRALLYESDPKVVGAEFFVMERREGTVIRRKTPPGFDADPQALSLALVDTLADLHAVDYEAIGLGDLGQPEGFVERQIEGWWRRWQKAQEGSEAALEPMQKAYEWLSNNLPKSTRSSLVHNDYKLDNVLFDEAGEVVAVFDWDMCTLGDPLSDLGALLTYWTEDKDPAPFRLMAQMPTTISWPSREALVQRYAERAGLDAQALAQAIPFYHALGLFRLTVIVAQIFVRYQRGQTKDPRFALLGQMTPLTAKEALRLTQSS